MLQLPFVFRPGTSALRGCLQREQARTAAHNLAKSLAEMAEARITNLKRGFGDVVFAALEQFSRFFHANLSQELGNGAGHL